MKHITINNFAKGFPIIACNALCLSVILAGCNNGRKKEEKQPAVATAPPPAAEAFICKKVNLAASIQIPGELIPFQQVDLYSKGKRFCKKTICRCGHRSKSRAVAGRNGSTGTGFTTGWVPTPD